MERVASRIILLWGWRRALVAFLAGALTVLALAPFDFFAICFVTFPVFVWLLDGSTAEPGAGFFGRLRPAFATGWWFGFGYFVCGLWWIGNALLVDGNQFAWALPLAIVILPAFLAIFYGLAAAAARIFWVDGPSRIAMLAVSFALAEWLRTFAFTGFPWNPIGFTAAPIPILMQAVSVIGVFGLNAVAVFVFAMPATIVSARFVRTGAVLAFLLAAADAGYGYYRLNYEAVPEGPELSVRIVQPSVPQNGKWDDAERSKIFKSLLALSSKSPGDGPKPQVIFWPETAVPFLLTRSPDALSAIADTLSGGQMLLTGAVRVEGDQAEGGQARYYNSIVAVDDKGEIVGASDKLHLVPFGEYLPFSDFLSRFGLTRIVHGPGAFSSGTERKIIHLPGGIDAVPFICYEMIFPQKLQSITGAAIIVNVTNDAWYGRTPGPYQHLRHAQLRAVEQGLPVIRAANNGISAVIDSKGNIVDALGLDVRDSLDSTFNVYRSASLYEEYQGKPGWVVLAALLFIGIITSFSRRSPRMN